MIRMGKVLIARNPCVEDHHVSYMRIEIFIAKLYLYLLPIRMLTQLSFMQAVFKGAAVYLDIIFHGIGILLVLYRCRGKIRIRREASARIVLSAFCLVVYLNLSSFFMACIIQFTYGNHGGESAFSGILGMLIYFSQYALMFAYNREIFRMISKDELRRIISRLCIALLILGYVQLATMLWGGVFSVIYNRLNILGVLYSAPMPKLCLTGSEGASAGSIISCFVMPFLYGNILEQEKKWPYVLQVLLWLPPLFYTTSTTGYILFSICTLAFAVMAIKSRQVTPGAIFWIFIAAVLLLCSIIFQESILSLLPDKIANQIRYLLLEKATDLSNGSTVSRMVPLLVNWGAFTEYPILGVGNGLQGYFYEKYFPSWAYNVPGSDVTEFLQISKTGIGNGGVFIPSLLSGYGIIGVLLITLFALRLVKLAKSGKGQMGLFYYMFVLGGICFLVSGFQGDMYGKYYIWFVITLPLMVEPDYNAGFRRLKYGRSKVCAGIRTCSDHEQAQDIRKNAQFLYEGKLFAKAGRNC